MNLAIALWSLKRSGLLPNAAKESSAWLRDLKRFYLGTGCMKKNRGKMRTSIIIPSFDCWGKFMGLRGTENIQWRDRKLTKAEILASVKAMEGCASNSLRPSACRECIRECSHHTGASSSYFCSTHHISLINPLHTTAGRLDGGNDH